MTGAFAAGVFEALRGARAASKLKMVICPMFRPFYGALECQFAIVCLTPLQYSQHALPVMLPDISHQASAPCHPPSAR